MRTLRTALQSLVTMPRGFPADGRMLGLGLAVGMQAQAERQAEAARLAPRHRDDDRVADAV